MKVDLTPYPEDEYMNDFDIRDHPAQFCWNPSCKCHTQRKEYLDRQVEAGLLTEDEKEGILRGKVV